MSKELITELAQASGFGFLGCVAGFMTFAERIGFLLALRYAVFAVICGPIAFYILDNTVDYSTYKHVGAIGAGYGGFFVFKGISVLLFRFSTKPVITAESIIDLFKKVKK